MALAHCALFHWWCSKLHRKRPRLCADERGLQTVIRLAYRPTFLSPCKQFLETLIPVTVVSSEASSLAKRSRDVCSTLKVLPLQNSRHIVLGSSRFNHSNNSPFHKRIQLAPLWHLWPFLIFTNASDNNCRKCNWTGHAASSRYIPVLKCADARRMSTYTEMFCICTIFYLHLTITHELF